MLQVRYLYLNLRFLRIYGRFDIDFFRACFDHWCLGLISSCRYHIYIKIYDSYVFMVVLISISTVHVLITNVYFIFERFGFDCGICSLVLLIHSDLMSGCLHALKCSYISISLFWRCLYPPLCTNADMVVMKPFKHDVQQLMVDGLVYYFKILSIGIIFMFEFTISSY
jgi:hypothetical protein